MLDLSLTERHMADLSGRVVVHRDGLIEQRWPELPLYIHGNCLWLPAPPTAAALPGLVSRFEAMWSDDPRIVHVCFCWDSGEADPALYEAAGARGMAWEHWTAMSMERGELRPAPLPPGMVVRPFESHEWASIAEANVAWDPSEGPDAEEPYVAFKEGIRAAWRGWLDGGHARWWGAWRDGVLVGQAGLVDTPYGGRFQSVETHPAHRRQGVCSALISAVAADALQRHPAVHLSAEPEGPALSLYTRLGFRAVGSGHSLWQAEDSELRVRPERPADRAGVDSLVRASFPSAAEREVVRALREAEGVVSLVVEECGTLLGHVLFSPVTVAGSWSAMGLGPVAVRADRRGCGIGQLLVREGLARLEGAGEPTCVVLGDPAWYGRFGFEDAAPHGLRCKWEVPAGVFQLRGPLRGPPGLVSYDPVFDEAT